jgi:hypothetical protein
MGSAPRRPVYLLVAMLALWVVGVHEADEGFGILRAIVDPLFGGSSEVLAIDAFLGAIRVHHRQLLPAYSAQLVINVTMFLLAVRLLFTGRANLGFTLQVIGVNIGVLAYAYYVSLPLRVAHVSALAVTPEIQRIAAEAGEDPAVAVTIWWWVMRGGLFAELSLLAACGFALTRPRARRFIQWASRSTPETD